MLSLDSFHPMMLLFIATLFFVLTPGVLLSLPPNSTKYVVAATHAVVFALVYHFTHKLALQYTEGFSAYNMPMRMAMPTMMPMAMPMASMAPRPTMAL